MENLNFLQLGSVHANNNEYFTARAKHPEAKYLTEASIQFEDNTSNVQQL